VCVCVFVCVCVWHRDNSRVTEHDPEVPAADSQQGVLNTSAAAATAATATATAAATATTAAAHEGSNRRQSNRFPPA